MDNAQTDPAPASARREIRIAVVIPCFNEAPTIGSVVRDFREALPDAEVFVFDNNSTDATAALARQAGARVYSEPRQGKGYVVQAMFRRVDADVYVMVDGDSTYPASAANQLLAPVLAGDADMVVGSRLHTTESEFRRVNLFGNRLFLGIFKSLFGTRITDLLSGYRVFSRRLVRGVPLFGGGFEIEAEITIKALQRGFRVVEVPVRLSSRPAGSRSKIRVFRDGFVILNAMLTLARDYKPLTVFGSAGLLLLAAAAVPAASAVGEGASTGRLPGVVPIVSAAVLTLLGALSIFAGLILHTLARHFQELDARFQMRLDEDSRDPRG